MSAAVHAPMPLRANARICGVINNNLDTIQRIENGVWPTSANREEVDWSQ